MVAMPMFFSHKDDKGFAVFFLEMSSQEPVVLASPINQIFLIHLHCFIAIFTLSYHYIYNDFFSVIY